MPRTPSRTAPVALGAALAGLTLGWLAGAAGPAVAAPPPPAPEHRVVLVEFDDFKNNDEYKALEKELGGAWRAQFAFHEAVLGRAAAEGFELVQALPSPKGPSSMIFYLRKAK